MYAAYIVAAVLQQQQHLNVTVQCQHPDMHHHLFDYSTRVLHDGLTHEDVGKLKAVLLLTLGWQTVRGR